LPSGVRCVRGLVIELEEALQAAMLSSMSSSSVGKYARKPGRCEKWEIREVPVAGASLRFWMSRN
jgi:hypothetical protein